MRKLIAGIVGLLFTTNIIAGTITALPAASALSGTELFETVQSGSKKTDANAIKTFVSNLGSGNSTSMTLANASVTGTTVNRFAKITVSAGAAVAVIATTSDTNGAIGIVTAGAGTTGNATIAIIGQVSCEFDGATTAGNYVVLSTTTNGKCKDAGSTYPAGTSAVYGRVLSTNVGAGTYVMELMTPDVAFQNGGNGKSSPGGSNTQVQYNNSNQFGGITGATSDGTTITLTNPIVNGKVDVAYAASITQSISGANQINIGALTGNLTLNLSGGVDGQAVRIRLPQDGTGSRLLTLGAKFRLGTDITAVTLSTTASKIDYLGVVYHLADDKYDVVAFVKGY